jgi:D-inositol-3-phosphate glycosyltransferase
MNLYVRRLAQVLGESGVEADVYTRRTDRQTPMVVPLGEAARVIHLSAGPVRRLPRSVLPLHIPSMVAALRAYVGEHDLEYDLLHSHYWVSGLAAMRFRARSGQDVPLIHMFHTLSKVKDFYLGREDPTESALRADGERCIITRADIVVGSTDGELEEMARLYEKTPAGYAVIAPGVDLATFRSMDRPESRRALGLEARRVIVFVGREDPMKGLDVLLRSVARLPERLREGLKVLLIGGREGRHSPDAARRRSLVSKLGLQDVVEVRGNVAQSELPTYYSAADLCAVPSAYESFGMAAVESMACQTPVVAFDVGGLAVTIRSDHTGFLAQPGNSEDYAQKLEAALCHPDLGHIGRLARMSVQNYSWERTAERTLDLYDTLLQSRAAGALGAVAGG